MCKSVGDKCPDGKSPGWSNPDVGSFCGNCDGDLNNSPDSVTCNGKELEDCVYGTTLHHHHLLQLRHKYHYNHHHHHTYNQHQHRTAHDAATIKHFRFHAAPRHRQR